MPPLEIAPAELKKRLEAGEKIHLIDVREPHEHAAARIEGSRLVPMNTVPANLQELDSMAAEAPLIVYCHHGMRSLNTANWLRGQGVENCQSLAGGIDLWSVSVDPGVPRY
ncbi:MAG: rhodanese-like domain-containing protein [Bryobacteraceae bacterium]|nr:rhodanese-like domain-containing protein [Bryobacteraceae bacterium]